MAGRLGVEGFDMGPLPVVLVAVGVRHTGLQDKGVGRPCGFFFMPTPPRCHIQKHVRVPTVYVPVWRAIFRGSAVEDSLAVFRAASENCIATDFFTHGGRGAQVWNSLRCLEFPYAVCAHGVRQCIWTEAGVMGGSRRRRATTTLGQRSS